MIVIRLKSAPAVTAGLVAIGGTLSAVENALTADFGVAGTVAHVLGWAVGMAVFGAFMGTAWQNSESETEPPRGMALRLFLRMTIGGAIGGAISGAVSAAVNNPEHIINETLGGAGVVAVIGAITGPLLRMVHRPPPPITIQ